MVAIRIGSKIGVPKWKGRIGANQAAAATLSKCIIPSAAAMMAPTTMPSSTAMLDRNPLAKRAKPITTASTISDRTMLEIGA